jgi:hypothetical protein
MKHLGWSVVDLAEQPMMTGISDEPRMESTEYVRI